MKIWVAYLIPIQPQYFDMALDEGLPFMAASEIGEDEAEAVLLRDIKEDYPNKEDVLEIYKAHRLHIRMIEYSTRKESFTVLIQGGDAPFPVGIFDTKELAFNWALGTAHKYVEEGKYEITYGLTEDDGGNSIMLNGGEIVLTVEQIIPATEFNPS